MFEMNKYPELEKMKSVRNESRTISEFLDWLDENNMRVCVRTEVAAYSSASPYEAIPERHEELLARFFDIDLKKVEEEREQILETQRKLNEARE